MPTGMPFSARDTFAGPDNWSHCVPTIFMWSITALTPHSSQALRYSRSHVRVTRRTLGVPADPVVQASARIFSDAGSSAFVSPRIALAM